MIRGHEDQLAASMAGYLDGLSLGSVLELTEISLKLDRCCLSHGAHTDWIIQIIHIILKSCGAVEFGIPFHLRVGRLDKSVDKNKQ